jgi:hypothetical protein
MFFLEKIYDYIHSSLLSSKKFNTLGTTLQPCAYGIALLRNQVFLGENLEIGFGIICTTRASMHFNMRQGETFLTRVVVHNKSWKLIVPYRRFMNS